MKTRFRLRPIARLLASRWDRCDPHRGLGNAGGAQTQPPRDPLLLSAMLTCIALAPAMGRAQEPAKKDTALPEVKVSDTAVGTSYNPPISTVGGGIATPVRDIPQSVTVINSTLMQAQGATSLADALRNVPGITMGAAEGGSIGNNFNLRGFSARTDIYLDGMRDRGQVYRDVFSLDAVEVLQGPSSMLFGRGSTGGIINQVSKVPYLTPLGQCVGHGRNATFVPGHGGLQPADERNISVSHCRDGPERPFHPRRDGEHRLRDCALAQVRDRHADRGDVLCAHHTL